MYVRMYVCICRIGTLLVFIGSQSNNKSDQENEKEIGEVGIRGGGIGPERDTVGKGGC